MSFRKKAEMLRSKMRDENLDAYIIYSADPHKSVAVADHWRTVRWISGFTGWVGTIVITKDKAAFWTDGRYVQQAERELAGTGIERYCMIDPEAPSIYKWMLAELPKNGRVGFDGRVVMIEERRKILSELASKKVELCTNRDLLGELWNERPGIPDAQIYDFSVEYCGKTRKEKLEVIRRKMAELGADWYITSGLDDIAWATNLRGADSELYPVFHGYLLISDERAYLFTDAGKISTDLLAVLKEDGIEWNEKSLVSKALNKIKEDSTIYYDPWKTSAALADSLDAKTIRLEGMDIITGLKCVKNDTELKNLAVANAMEGASIVRLIRYIRNNINSGDLDESFLGPWIDNDRRRYKSYICPANVPIVGCYDNATQLHYRPVKGKCDILPKKGFLLFDVCAHYNEGSTDITRTIALGPLTQQMKEDYTFVLKQHIRLAMQKYIYGTTGPLLDSIIKSEYWNRGLDNPAGTGHGMGYATYIQEGPCKIAVDASPFFHYTFTAPVEPGMIFSNEPGIYRKGSHAIRIENTITAVESMVADGKRFLGFETLTYIPLEREAILADKLTEAELNWVNEYNKETYKRLAPYLNEEDSEWLKQETSPIRT